MPIPAAILARDDVYFTAPPLTYQAARARFNAILQRNPTVLNGLHCGSPLDLAFYQADHERIWSQEWGLAREGTVVDPHCILISGGPGGMQWGAFLAAGLVPLAHSHPYHEHVHNSRALPVGGVLWDRISGVAPPQNLHARLLVFPSAGDFAFCAASNLAAHTVYTPYCIQTPPAGRTIVNPNAPGVVAGTARLRFRLESVRWVDDGHYLANITALSQVTTFWHRRGVHVHGGGAAGVDL